MPPEHLALPLKPTERRQPLTLRRALLAAFLVLGLLPAAALSWLSFSKTRDAMTREITRSLSAQAQTIQTDIDAMMAERLQNAIVWSRSELMQDLRLGDVDKRVTNYLRGLESEYGDVYRSLDCVDSRGIVLASSDPVRIGNPRAMPDARQLSVDARSGDGHATLYLPHTARLEQRQPLLIVTDVPMTFASTPMRMLLDFDVANLNRLLDAAEQDHRAVVVVDRQGRWVAASHSLRSVIWSGDRARAAGMELVASGQTRVDVLPWMDKPAMVGQGHSRATSRLAASGWTTLVFEAEDDALAPVAQMAAIFEGLLLAVLLATVLTALWIASTISHPIASLTAFTRRYQREGGKAVLVPTGSRVEEIDVLEGAFLDMVRSVELSKRELIRSSKMAMLGELAAVLAHEVRTPLGILRSSAQILMRNKALSSEERELTQFIESETERLNHLVSTMLDMARPPQPRFTSCDLHMLLQRCAHMHDLKRGGDGEKFPVALKLAARNTEVDGDPEQLMQVFFNLLSNASEAAGAQGRVELETFDQHEHVGVRCSDNGPGISPELVETLFEPFVSRREGGIGLGLAVARQIVLAHAGDITVGRSHLGGAEFTLRLRRRCAFDILEAKS
jgi:signal transduction histidine kinase